MAGHLLIIGFPIAFLAQARSKQHSPKARLDALYRNELKVNLRRTGLRQRVDRRMLVQVHAALFPNVRLMTVSERSIRSATLTVAVTHPGTNLHNCCLTSDSDLTAI